MTETYHSLHVAPLQSQHELLAWRLEGRRADRIRVREHTCPCRKVVYEFCLASGLAFIRRTYRNGNVVMHESDWLRVREVEQLWLQIILGSAR